MAIITISRGCFSHGKEVAEKVGDMLGYKVLSRESIIEEAGQRYHVPEKELIKSVHAPSVLDRFTGGKEQYLTYIQATLLDYARADKLVYHGHASHLLMPDIKHVLNVRIIANIRDRVAFMREKQNLSEKEAMRHINHEDTSRSRWASALYKIDITDPHLYDMIVNINSLNIDDACQMICYTAQMDSFQTMPESWQAIEDLAVASQIKAAIANAVDPGLPVTVHANNGNVHVHAEAAHIRKTGYTHPKIEKHMKEQSQQDIKDAIAEAISGISGIKNVVYEVAPPSYA
ncbi:MAG: cytidylate kinase-like family protein [Thermodesulfobacteriota bacterium]|nr:cytidylate kinase-like family protein [Thermodesulfobacteriota bacterium]